MRVERWVSYDDSDSLPSCIFGTLGGWVDGQSWPEYLENILPAARPYAEALRQEILTHQLWEPGDWHQQSDAGVPVYSDGTAATFTLRAWGDLMAAVWNGEGLGPFSYMDFYYLDTPDRGAGTPTDGQ